MCAKMGVAVAGVTAAAVVAAAVAAGVWSGRGEWQTVTLSQSHSLSAGFPSPSSSETRDNKIIISLDIVEPPKKNTLGPAILSFAERLSSSQGLKMN